MRLTDILSEQRIHIDTDGTSIPDRNASLLKLGGLISTTVGLNETAVYQLLLERENLQSTGIGDGVAIPHASTDEANVQAAALVICRPGIEFNAIDGARVHIVFGVVGPRRATGEHLRTLARISRLLRDANNRQRLIDSEDRSAAFRLIQAQDANF